MTMNTQLSNRTIRDFLKNITIRHPITFGKKVMIKIITGSEMKMEEQCGHITNTGRRHLEKTILVMLRFLLTGDKNTTVEDDVITALRGIVRDDIIDANMKTIRQITSLNKLGVVTVHRLTGIGPEGLPSRGHLSASTLAVVTEIIEWLYTRIMQDADGQPVYLPVIHEDTADLMNVVITARTVWSIDIWAKRLRVYTPRQAMCVLGVIKHPIPDFLLPITPLPNRDLAPDQIGVLVPQTRTVWWYPNATIPNTLPHRWADTFTRYRYGLHIG